MAIVRTTPKETNTTGSTPPEKGANGSNAAASIDRTKSVVNQGGSPVARPARAQNRPAVAARPGTPVKTTSAGSLVNDTMTELRRVVWPSRETVQSGTIVTIGLLIFFSLYIFGLDSLFSWLFHALGLYPNTPV